jgi:hypothetical protein
MIRIVPVGLALLAGLAVAHAGPALEVVATMSGQTLVLDGGANIYGGEG